MNWHQQLDELLTAGYNPDGDATSGALLTFTADTGEQSSAPLARHCRVDDGCIWIRPIIGAGPTFDLNECRRRYIPTAHVTAHHDHLEFTCADGVVTISQIRDPAHVEVLDAWDTFVLTALDADSELAIAELQDDSWV